MNTKKRKGTTLVEVLVAIVLFSLFMLMVSGVFRITYSAYEQNHLMAQRLYTESNMENLFSILEKEFMYQGSMGHVLKHIEGFPEDSFETSGSVATITYALAEKLVLAREHSDQYPSGEGDKIEEGNQFAFFAHFPATFPSSMEGNEDLWALNYDSFHEPESAQLIKADFQTELHDELGTYVEVKTIKVGSEKVPLNNEDPKDFISIFQREKALIQAGKHFKVKEEGEGNDPWRGERVYRTCFSLQDNTVKMERYIPTVDVTISMDLLDNVEGFHVSDEGDFFTVAATCSLTLPGKSTPSMHVGKQRRFFKWGE